MRDLQEALGMPPEGFSGLYAMIFRGDIAAVALKPHRDPKCRFIKAIN
jgi:hypothetical protein